jgi:hypothetical protein
MPGGPSAVGVFVGCALPAQPAIEDSSALIVNARQRTQQMDGESLTDTGRLLA